MVQSISGAYSGWRYVGGWGFRWGAAGTAYNTKGSYGIQMVLKKSGHQVLVGTQHPEEVRQIIQKFRTLAEDSVQTKHE